MADTFRLEVTTPDRMVVREDVEEAQIPLENGYIGVAAGHAPLLGQVKPGELSYGRAGHTQYLAVGNGYVEVLPEHTKVLVESAETPVEIDVKRAEAARERGEARLRSTDSTVDVERARLAIERALVRVRVAGRLR